MSRSSDFVADYAAKRAAQMERAKMLKEMRKETSSGNMSRQVNQTNQQHDSYGYDSAPAQPISSAIHSNVAYPPPMGRGYNPPAPAPAPAPVHQSGYSQYSQHSAGGLGSQPQPSQRSSGSNYSSLPPSVHEHVPARTIPSQMPSVANGKQSNESVEVSQDDFKRAVAMGIISADQARQLWGVLSNSPVPPMLPQAAPQKSPLTMKPVPNSFDDMPAGNQRYQSQSSEPKYSPSAYDQYQPTKRATPKGKPEWNYDTEPIDQPVREDRYAPEQQIREKPKATAKPRQEWNQDFADENVMAREPAPMKKAPVSKQAPANQATPGSARGNDQARQVQREEQEKPRGIPLSLRPQSQAQPQGQNQNSGYGQQQAQSRNQNATQQPPPSAGGRSDDEIAEFMRAKEEAKLKFQEALEEGTTDEPLEECRICERRFRQSIIDRHEQACQKAHKKRKEFNAAAHRADGVEGLKEAQRNAARMPSKNAKPQAPASAAGKMPKWKIQSQQLQAAMNAMRAQNAQPGSVPVHVEPIDDRVPCPHCGRKFASETADRHIPKCKTTQAKPTMLLRKR